MSSGTKREERGEEEQQHRQRAEAAQEGLDEKARCLRVLGALGEQVVAGDAEVEAGVRARLLQDRLHRHVRSDVGEALERLGVDQRVRRAPVLGEEHGRPACRRSRPSGCREGPSDTSSNTGVILSSWSLTVVPSGTVTTAMVGGLEPPLWNCRQQLRLGLVAGLAGQREVDHEPLARLARGDAADGQHDHPEDHHQDAVLEDELGKSDHRGAPLGRVSAATTLGETADTGRSHRAKFRDCSGLSLAVTRTCPVRPGRTAPRGGSGHGSRSQAAASPGSSAAPSAPVASPPVLTSTSSYAGSGTGSEVSDTTHTTVAPSTVVRRNDSEPSGDGSQSTGVAASATASPRRHSSACR